MMFYSRNLASSRFLEIFDRFFLSLSRLCPAAGLALPACQSRPWQAMTSSSVNRLDQVARELLLSKAGAFRKISASTPENLHPALLT